MRNTRRGALGLDEGFDSRNGPLESHAGERCQLIFFQIKRPASQNQRQIWRVCTQLKDVELTRSSPKMLRRQANGAHYFLSLRACDEQHVYVSTRNTETSTKANKTL